MTLRDYFEGRALDGSWAALYDGAPSAATYNFLTRRAAVLELLGAELPGARVLDVGCGTGDYGEAVARTGATYCGVDFAPTMVALGRARSAAAAPRARFAVADGTALPFADASFDTALAIGYIAYFHDPRPALDELRRVLRRGGTLVVQCAKPDLCGWIDRAVLWPLRSALRRRRAAAPALPDGWVNVRYAPRALDGMLRSAGFARTARTFNHFQPFPGPLRQRFPALSIRLSEAITRGRPAWFRPLAVNYIGKYVAE